MDKECHRHNRLHQKYQSGSGCRQDQGASPADAARLNALLNSGRRIGGQRFVYHFNVSRVEVAADSESWTYQA